MPPANAIGPLKATLRSLQDVTIQRTVILLSNDGSLLGGRAVGLSLGKTSLLLSDGAVLLVKLLVLVGKEQAKTDGEESSEEHESGADGLSLDVVRTLGGRVQSRSEKRTALTDEVQDDDTGTTTRVGTLVVYGRLCQYMPSTSRRSDCNLLRTHGKMLAMEGKIPAAAKKTPA